MGQVRQLDKRMNEAGLLRLMVFDPLAMNMSNTLGYLRGELTGRPEETFQLVLARISFCAGQRKIMLAVYNKIFNWYYS